MTTLHAHIEAYSVDCDGATTQTYVMNMTDAEKANVFGDIEFHNRVVGMVVNTYSLMAEGNLKVNRFEDGSVRLSWSETTDEGGVNREALICSDDCDDAERPTYRDHRAEENGY